MNDPRDIFIAARNDLTLTREERALMRSNLEDAMARTPRVTVAVPSPLVFLFQPARAFAFVLTLAVLGSGGAAWAAEGALPGDTLYAVKLSVNERLEQALAVGEVAKASVEVRHAEERLQEVELLAAKGEVAQEVLDEAAEKVEAHVERVGEVARALAEEGDETAADAMHTRISSALSAHAEIIRAQSEDAQNERPLRVLALKVENAADDAEDAQQQDIGKPQEDDAWAMRLVASREESVRAQMQKLTEGLADDGVAPETQETITKELAQMEEDLAVASALAEGEEYRESANAYEALSRRAYRAQVLLASAQRIEDTTDKEVLITVETIVEESEATNEDAAGAMLMKMAAPEESEVRTREEFRFRVRDRRED